jgi:hypothetical protein
VPVLGSCLHEPIQQPVARVSGQTYIYKN